MSEWSSRHSSRPSMPGPWIPQNGQADGSSPAETRSAGVFHLVGEGMEDADHHDALGPAVEAPMDDRGDLVSAVEDTRVREDGHPTGGQSRRQIPLPPALEALERAPARPSLRAPSGRARGSAP